MLSLWMHLAATPVKKGMEQEEKKNIISRGTVVKQTATTNCNHFTVLGFTAATRDPIMCAIIVSGKTMKPEVVTGLDLFAKKLEKSQS
jgi:hypothetical protein